MSQVYESGNAGGGGKLCERPVQLPLNARNYGIDVLKILAMFMVVILHLLGQGGVLNNCAVGSSQYYAAWFLETAAICSVNCFAIVTGYLMANRGFKYARVVNIWFQVVFYGVTINAIMLALLPEAIGLKEWAYAVAPITFRARWYISAYVGVFLFAPYINRLLNVLTKGETFRLAALIVVLLSIVNTASFGRDPFNVNRGYGFLWLGAMYVLGACVRKHGIGARIKKRWFILAYLFIALATTVFTTGIWSSILPENVGRILEKKWPYPLLGQYTSPTIVVMSLALLLFFERCEVPKRLQKTVAFLTPISFAAYVIHTHPAIFWSVLPNKLDFAGRCDAFSSVAIVLGVALAISVVSMIVEAIRVQLFKVLRINRLESKIGAFFDKKIGMDWKPTGEGRQTSTETLKQAETTAS